MLKNPQCATIINQLLKLTLMSIACIPSALSAPNISDLSISNDGVITIEGNGFGPGPNVVLYDDFSEAKVGPDFIKLSPKKGAWPETRHNGDPAKALRQGLEGTNGTSLAVRSADGTSHHSLTFGVEDPTGVHGFKHFQEVYFSYSIKDEGEFPGPNGGYENFSDVSATKDAWMMFGYRGDNTRYAVDSLGIPSGHDLYIPAWTGSGFTIAGNNTQMSPRFGQSELKDNWSFGSWVTKMFHAKLDPDSPYGVAGGFFAYLNNKAYGINHRDGNFMVDQSSEGVPYPYWDRILFFAWLRTGDAEVTRLVDNVYVAIGDNANARILLSDSKLLETSSRVKHMLPRDWTNKRITVETSFSDIGSLRYLHIVNAKNEFSDSMVICHDCPTAPSLIEIR
jgi:hypothetical protein